MDPTTTMPSTPVEPTAEQRQSIRRHAARGYPIAFLRVDGSLVPLAPGEVESLLWGHLA